MSLLRTESLSWSVCSSNDPRGRVEHDPLLAELVGYACDLTSHHFPASAGYVVQERRTSGALQGATFTVSRGAFRALLSVQRFAAHHDPNAHEYRVVASARPDTASLARVEHHENLRRWTLMGSVAGALGLISVGLGLASVFALWMELLVLIPVLFAWRLSSRTSPFGSDDTDDHEQRQRAHQRVLADGLGRWQQVLGALAVQRDRWSEGPRMRPFRSSLTAVASDAVPHIR